MAKDRDTRPEERREKPGRFPEDLPGDRTDLPGRQWNEDVEKMPGRGGSVEKM